MQLRLSLCIFVPSVSLNELLRQSLSEDRYTIHQINSSSELLNYVLGNKEQIDCLVVLNQPILQPVFNKLYEDGILLPVLIIDQEEQLSEPKETEEPTYIYHSAEIKIATLSQEVNSLIERAIAQFLHLGHSFSTSEKQAIAQQINKVETKQSFLMLQQRRLAEKLKERLGYLGVYYKRNPKYFYRRLSQKEKKELMQELSVEYRQIILNYFLEENEINQEIDQFVNKAFFADLSVSQILEIHMELMDEFAQQLKIEGRSEEILLDYRLALIDIIAHLGEMYRRSIPREDLLVDVLFRLD